MTDGRVNRGEEIGEPGIPKHLLLTIDREDRPFEAIGIEHDRRGSEFANAVCQLATDDEPRAHLSRGIIEVNRVHDPDRETRAQARQLTGEQVTIDGGFNGYQDLGLHTHWLPIIPTTTSAEKSTIPVHKYELALPLPNSFARRATLLPHPEARASRWLPQEAAGSTGLPQLTTIRAGQRAYNTWNRGFSLAQFVESAGSATGS
jgi:hypothetical protein